MRHQIAIFNEPYPEILVKILVASVIASLKNEDRNSWNASLVVGWLVVNILVAKPE